MTHLTDLYAMRMAHVRNLRAMLRRGTKETVLPMSSTDFKSLVKPLTDNDRLLIRSEIERHERAIARWQRKSGQKVTSERRGTRRRPAVDPRYFDVRAFAQSMMA